ncbi:MAG: GntR family transcriptional regulator [Chitinophagaceae bacterium]|nr:GntR family transcriptional regulator [Chitinophagaceae bacterium]
MASENIYRIINIDEHSITAKYIQLTNAIVQAVEHEKIEKDYLLPSINEMSYELGISRDTVEKAYRKLKSLGVVGSIPGRGYFISKTDFKQPIKVFLIFNKLSAHKKIIYDSIVRILGEKAAIDFYIYNNDFNLFKKLIQGRKDEYTHYVIIPHFVEGSDLANDIINEIVGGQLILLDKLIPGIQRNYSAVYENFEQDIFGALKEAIPKLQKYRTLKIVFPAFNYFPDEILKGFKAFCKEYVFEFKVVNDIGSEMIEEGDVFINLVEDDLVILLGKIQHSNFEVGKNIGIISYNETPWKAFILNGITTISTDFKKMGELTAQMILHNEKAHIEVPFSLTLRKSL